MQVGKTFLSPLIALSLAMLVFSSHGDETLTLETLPKIKGVDQYVGTSSQLHVATDKGLYVSRDEFYSRYERLNTEGPAIGRRQYEWTVQKLVYVQVLHL